MMISLAIEVFAIKMIAAKNLILETIETDENNMHIKMTLIERDIAIAYWIDKIESEI